MKETFESHRKMTNTISQDTTKNPVSLKKNMEKKRLLSLTQKMEKKKKDKGPGNAIIPIRRSLAVTRALEIRASLSPQFPSCVKVMVRSHVSGCFWMGLEKQFCVSCLPNDNADVVLVDEDGMEYKNVYLAHRNGLSGGWRAFAIAKNLQIDDVVIFQCVEPCKLEVYIVRANTELDGTVSLLDFDLHAQPMDTDQAEGSRYICETDNREYEEPLLLDSYNMESTLLSNSDYYHVPDEFNPESHNRNYMNSGSEILEGAKFSRREVNLRGVKKFRDFTIQKDCLNLDSKLPTHLRRKYYELCSSQNMFLHKNLIEGLNHNLGTGIISETINIADAIREVKPADISVTHLEIWDRTLKAFDGLGMRVGFLRHRISKLVGLYTVIKSKRSEKDDAENEMRFLKARLRSVRSQVKILNLEINDLVAENEKIDSELMKVARAPW